MLNCCTLYVVPPQLAAPVVFHVVMMHRIKRERLRFVCVCNTFCANQNHKLLRRRTYHSHQNLAHHRARQGSAALQVNTTATCPTAIAAPRFLEGPTTARLHRPAAHRAACAAWCPAQPPRFSLPAPPPAARQLPRRCGCSTAAGWAGRCRPGALGRATGALARGRGTDCPTQSAWGGGGPREIVLLRAVLWV